MTRYELCLVQMMCISNPESVDVVLHLADPEFCTDYSLLAHRV